MKNVDRHDADTTRAEVKGKDTLDREVKDDDDADVSAHQRRRSSCTKTGPAKVHAGDDVTFTITAENTGNDPIDNVDITDAKCDPALSDTPDSGDTNSNVDPRHDRDVDLVVRGQERHRHLADELGVGHRRRHAR